jgi:hypothetical protein
MKTAENEIVEYLYEYMIKRMIPVNEMPRTFRVFCDGVIAGRIAAMTATLPYNRSEFEEIIRALISFEKNSVLPYIGWNSNLEQDGYPPAVTDISPIYGCHNYHQLFTWYEFLQEVPNDFIITLNVQAVRSNRPKENSKKVSPIEFRVWIEGLTLMNSNRRLSEPETTRVIFEWSHIRRKNGYADNLTQYINARLETVHNLSGVTENLIFMILYTPTTMNDIE